MNISSLQSPLAPQTPTSADNPKLKAAAHEFEASLMQELLKPLQRDSLFAPDKSDGPGSDSDDDQGSAGALMSFGSEAVARAISDHGGFGIATKILDHFRTENGAANLVKSANSK